MYQQLEWASRLLFQVLDIYLEFTPAAAMSTLWRYEMLKEKHSSNTSVYCVAEISDEASMLTS